SFPAFQLSSFPAFKILILLFSLTGLVACQKEKTVPSIIVNRGSEDFLEVVGESCVPGSIDIGLGCNDVEYNDTLAITLSAYPGCTFIVAYKHYECEAAGLFDYTMGDFQILSHDCANFSADVNN